MLVLTLATAAASSLKPRWWQANFGFVAAAAVGGLAVRKIGDLADSTANGMNSILMGVQDALGQPQGDLWSSAQASGTPVVYVLVLLLAATGVAATLTARRRV
jgi:hypothetical protein